jgi:hypothetical protein
LANGDTLNVRSGPSTGNPVVATARNGETLQNLGCTMTGSTRWCQVRTSAGKRGWVAGRYLREASGEAPVQLPEPVPSTLPSFPDPSLVSRAEMPRFCAGEGSDRFGVRPRDITTQAAVRKGGNYEVRGYFGGSGNRRTSFTCYFGLDGSFVQVN